MAVESDGFGRVIGALQARGATIRYRSTDSVRATCPAHQDQHPSLGVTRREGKVLLHCFGGCPSRRVVAELGLHMADLFSGPRVARRRAEIEAIYDHRDRESVVVAQKVRFEGKTFKWRRPDSSARGGCRWGLDGPVPGLYRSPELIGARVVFVVEGEKAEDRLRSVGLVATCPPAGASSWKSEWSRDLLWAGCRELVILADHDQAGERHAERVAADIHALECDEPIAVVASAGRTAWT